MNETKNVDFQEDAFKSLVEEHRLASARGDRSAMLEKVEEILDVLPDQFFSMNNFVIEEIKRWEKSSLTRKEFRTSKTGQSYHMRSICDAEKLTRQEFLLYLNTLILDYEENPFYGPYFSKEAIIDAIHEFNRKAEISLKEYNERIRREIEQEKRAAKAAKA